MPGVLRLMPVRMSLGWLLLLGQAACAQVMPSRNWQRALAQARSLMPGNGFGNVPYRLHYDLHFRDAHGKDADGTYDISVDPYRFRRVDMASGDFHATEVEELQQHTVWRTESGEEPLRLFDFDGIVREPAPAIFALEHIAPGSQPALRRQVLEGLPYDCVDDRATTQLCFDPFTHVFALAQMLNQTWVYGNWVPLRGRAIPSLIRIYDGDKLLLTANGRIEELHTFAPLFFTRPASLEAGPTELRPVVNLPQFHTLSWCGNAAIRFTVDAEGKTGHVKLVDSDNRQIEHELLEFARHLRFRPASEAPAAPAAFTTVFYLRYLSRVVLIPASVIPRGEAPRR